tara:strand:- start:51 stop:629 length:579 start_codon:yes stop_codon:yes gene_type:complete
MNKSINEARTSTVDLYIVYQFIRRLATPFKEWPAYKTGVIDDRGNIKKNKRTRTREEDKSFQTFDLMILKLKKLLEKIPGGRTRLASYAAALFLIREKWEHKTEEQILSEDNADFADYIRVFRLTNFKKALEEMPANSMGGGAIAGGGINGPDDVKVAKKARKRYKTNNKREAEDYHGGLKAFVNMKFNGLK